MSGFSDSVWLKQIFLYLGELRPVDVLSFLFKFPLSFTCVGFLAIFSRDPVDCTSSFFLVWWTFLFWEQTANCVNRLQGNLYSVLVQ